MEPKKKRAKEPSGRGEDRQHVFARRPHYPDVARKVNNLSRRKGDRLDKRMVDRSRGYGTVPCFLSPVSCPQLPVL